MSSDNWVVLRPQGTALDGPEQQMFNLGPNQSLSLSQIKGTFHVKKVEYLVHDDTRVRVNVNTEDMFVNLQKQASYTFVSDSGMLSAFSSIVNSGSQAIELEMIQPSLSGNTFERHPDDYEYVIVMAYPTGDTATPESLEQVRAEVSLIRKHLTAAGLETTIKKSQDGDEVFILVTTTEERLSVEADRISMKKYLKDNGGLAPFAIEFRDRFVHSNKSAPFFSSGERVQLVASIIAAPNSAGGAEFDLEVPVLEGRELHLTAFFPLHHKAEQEHLSDVWASFSVLVTWNIRKWFAQPYDMVRDYYGEQVSLYFAWLGFYTLWLTPAAFLGFIIFLAQQGGNSAGATIFYSVFIALWAVVYLEYWKRRENELKFKWGTEGFEETEGLRKEFKGLVRLNPITEKEEVVVSVPWRLAQFSLSFAVVFCMMMCVIMTNLAILYIRMIFVEKTANDEASFPDGLTLADGSTSLDSLEDCDALETILYQNMTEGNRNTTWDDTVEICYLDETAEIGGIAGTLLVLTSTIMSVAAISIWSMIYEHVALTLNEWENHWTDTQYEDALILKNFAFQFVNNYFAMFYIAYLKSGTLFGKESTCTKGDCMGELTLQLGTVFTLKTAIAQTMEILMPFIKARIKKHMEDRALEKAGGVKSNDELPPWEAQAKLEGYKGTFDDYNEMAIQFGFVTLFAPAYPLAPLLALANNITEIRGDSLKLTRGLRRPEYKHAEDIGTWMSVLNIVSIAAVLTNSFMIAFVSKQLCDSDESIHDEDTNGDGMITEADDATSICDDVQNRYSQGYLWAYALIIEHCVLIFRSILQAAIPDEPAWVRAEKEAQEAKQKQMLTSAEEQQAQAKRLAEFEARMQQMRDD